MKRYHSYAIVNMLVLLLAMIACALPGQTIQPDPGIGPITIESAVAGTAQAAAQQTEQANPIPATETKIATHVPETPEVISSYGTSLVKRADGSTQFKDYRAGVQILFPPNWLPVRPGESEYYEAWEKMGSQNQWLLEEIGSIQNLDLNVFRVNVYDTSPEHSFYGTLPKINVVYQQGDTRTLKQVEADEKKMIKVSVSAGHEFLASDFRAIPGVPQVLVFENQSSSKSSEGAEYKFYDKGTYFQVSTGMVFIDLYLPADHKEILEPDYEKIIGSITLFNP